MLLSLIQKTPDLEMKMQMCAVSIYPPFKIVARQVAWRTEYFCRMEFSLAKYVSDNSLISWGSLVNTYTPLPLGALVVFVQLGVT